MEAPRQGFLARGCGRQACPALMTGTAAIEVKDGGLGAKARVCDLTIDLAQLVPMVGCGSVWDAKEV